ncbi:MAG: 4-alpha-glucanotransferase [Polyangiaceae bacterium]
MRRNGVPMAFARLAGVVLPLFSIRTRSDWGIGQISDLSAAAAFVRRAGHTLLQVLPPYELADGETSPYGARTAFGLDPIYLTLERIPELAATEGDVSEWCDAAARAERDRLRALREVDYRGVRALKNRALDVAFRRFWDRHWTKDTSRAAELRAFIAAESGWLRDLSLYVVLRDAHGGHGWTTWEEAARNHDAAALAAVERDHARALVEYAYRQWLALREWDEARRAVRNLGVELMGDLPFVVGSESADVWARPSEFRRDVSLGAPPDGFSPDGQDWGLPPYDWAAMDANDLAWLRARTRHAARLYDRFRLDHVIGYFRMYVRKPKELGVFTPEGDDAQRKRGDHVLAMMKDEAGATRIIGEDLGVIPDFARHVLSALEIPGYRVLPWERDHEHRLRDPKNFPVASVATFSTHDTAPIDAWWNDFQDYERNDFANLAGFAVTVPPFARSMALLRTLFGSSSHLTLVLFQELLGLTERINVPGTVGPHNWTWRIPADVESLLEDANVTSRLEAVRALVSESGR